MTNSAARWLVARHVCVMVFVGRGRDLAEARHREFAGGTEVERSVFGQVRTWW